MEPSVTQSENAPQRLTKDSAFCTTTGLPPSWVSRDLMVKHLDNLNKIYLDDARSQGLSAHNKTSVGR